MKENFFVNFFLIDPTLVFYLYNKFTQLIIYEEILFHLKVIQFDFLNLLIHHNFIDDPRIVMI